MKMKHPEVIGMLFIYVNNFQQNAIEAIPLFPAPYE